MIKQNLIILLVFTVLLPANAQVNKQETGIKREVTLYNPYKPSLPEAKKKSFFPDINDTTRLKPVSRKFDVTSEHFSPEPVITPVKAVSLLPDPLDKLYKGYIKMGIGNYITPLAELSLTNERSKKGAIGFYGRHFSTNGKIELQNYKKVFAGYMDNDASLFGKKFFKSSTLEISADVKQMTRYAYGYDTSYYDYEAEKKDIRLNYLSPGARITYSSNTTDSSRFHYKFDIGYNYFRNTENLFQHSFGFHGLMAKSFKRFYIGSGLGYDSYRIPDWLLKDPKYIASISPFLKKRTEQWYATLGFEAMLERNMDSSAVAHFYPNLEFGFSVIPSYLGFYVGLSGKLKRNDPLTIIPENPFLVQDGTLFSLPSTSYPFILTAGLRGSTGKNGSYTAFVSYSHVKDMLFYANYIFPYALNGPEVGNHFVPLPDNVDVLNVHGEFSQALNNKVTLKGRGDWYDYSPTSYDYAWNKPGWEAMIGLNYNLRDKIIAGIDLTGTGKRKLPVKTVNEFDMAGITYFETSNYFNLDLSAEYRYSKILSFWLKVNTISFTRYYEWAYYPSHRFIFMAGFTYSL